ncbi:hypothetical protein [Acetobacterium sp.]|uniref:hypothetical protein n=1 Tax=Acetobacterium sp. TaxID=1872094 RepID=UPI0027186347|nr:hypothetical protein [Acetobacterium sp.]MDO9492909.1 hypothetical protein [Acetobacterium sp.]
MAGKSGGICLEKIRLVVLVCSFSLFPINCASFPATRLVYPSATERPSILIVF